MSEVLSSDLPFSLNMCRYFSVCISAWTHGNICQCFSYLISYRPKLQSWHFSSQSSLSVSNWLRLLSENTSCWTVYAVVNSISTLLWTHLWTILLALNVEWPLPFSSQKLHLCLFYFFFVLLSSIFFFLDPPPQFFYCFFVFHYTLKQYIDDTKNPTTPHLLGKFIIIVKKTQKNNF